jgi:hypothetical protein
MEATMKALAVLGAVVLAIIVIAVLVLGYYGFMPNVFGSNKARKLGVSWTSRDYASARAKTGTTITDLPAGSPPERSLGFSGQHTVNTTFTQAEFNALLNNRPWKYYPLRDVNLKIEPDGSVEFSAVLLKGRLRDCAVALGANETDLDALNKYLDYIPTNPAIYGRGTAAVVNGQITGVNMSQFSVGKLSLTGQIQNNLEGLIKLAQDVIIATPGLTVKTFRFFDGQVQFEGTLPDVARARK